MEANTLFDVFVIRLNEHITQLDTRIAEMERKYSAHTYLMQNYKYQDASIVDSISSIPLEKVCELLTIFEGTPRFTKVEIENSLKFCKICESNPKFKEHERYKELFAILDYIHKLFVSHVFKNKQEVNTDAIEQTKMRKKRFTELQSFIKGELPDYELEDLSSYRIDHANFSDEEWIRIYYHLTTLQIESYKRNEDKLREEINLREEQRRTAMAEALQAKIIDSLPKEEADLIKPTVTGSESNEQEVEEEIPEPTIVAETSTTKAEGRALLTDEEISKLYEVLQEKYRAYRSLGKITPTKRDNFKINYDALKVGNTLENIKIAYSPSDYQKFLFFCFCEKLSIIATDIQERYTEDFDDYAAMVLEDMNIALDYITKLEKELEIEEQEPEDEPTKKEEGVKTPKPYKLIFYDNGNNSELEKSIKGMTPEKLSELVSLLQKLEEGRFDGVKMMKKKTKIGFKLINGQLVFLTYRTLTNNHIMIYTAGSMEELNNNRVDNRLVVYDPSIEKKTDKIIKDGTLEYRKLMKKNDGIKEALYKQVLTKGV